MASALRGIEGGYDIDRLPLAMHRRPDETLACWLHRSAYSYGVHARELLQIIGAPAPPQRHLDVGKHFATQRGARALPLLGVSAGELTAQIGFTANVRDLRRRYARLYSEPPPATSSPGCGWCVQCMRDYGVWFEAGRDPLSAICTSHGLWRVTRCPRCHGVPYSTPHWTTSRLDPMHCPSITLNSYGRYRRRCGFDLREAPTLEPSDRARNAQRRLITATLDAVNVPDKMILAAGTEMTSATLFDGILELAALNGGRLFRSDGVNLWAYAGPAALRNFDGPIKPLTPESSSVMDVISQPTVSAAAARARRYGLFGRAGHPVRLLGPKKTTRANPRTSLVTALWMSELRGQIAPSYQLQFRLGSSRPRYPDEWQTHTEYLHPRDARGGLPLSWIPQCAWQGALRLEDARALGLEAPRGRVFVSLCLAKYGTTRSWRTVAAALGLPASSAKHFAEYWGTITAAGRGDAFLLALDELFHRLHDSPPPIDYHQRRVRAWEPADLSGLLCKRLGALDSDPDFMPTGSLLINFWQRYTGGDPTLAPPGYLFTTDDRPPDALSTRVDSLATLDTEPLTWSPP